MAAAITSEIRRGPARRAGARPRRAADRASADHGRRARRGMALDRARGCRLRRGAAGGRGDDRVVRPAARRARLDARERVAHRLVERRAPCGRCAASAPAATGRRGRPAARASPSHVPFFAPQIAHGHDVAAPDDQRVLARGVGVGERQVALGARARCTYARPSSASASAAPWSRPSTTLHASPSQSSPIAASACDTSASARSRVAPATSRVTGALVHAQLEPHAPQRARDRPSARCATCAARPGRPRRRCRSSCPRRRATKSVPLRAERRVAVAHARVGQPHVAARAAPDDDALHAVERERALRRGSSSGRGRSMGIADGGSDGRDARRATAGSRRRAARPTR